MAIAVVLAISATASFAPPIWARALAPIRVAGMELPFYMGAQGAIVIYVLLVIAYAAVMEQADRRLRARLASLPAHDPLHDDDPAIEDLPR
jgi:putative solute:sodium symporter small subunit